MLNHKGTVLLETERLILRGLKIEDAQDVFDNWTSDKDVTKFIRWTVHSDVEITKEWMKECELNMEDKTHYDWGIILKSGNKPIGSIGAFINESEPNRYEVGYVLSKKYWRQGFAKEALDCVMKFLINEVGIKNFICLHSIENPASGSVMRHVGFEYVKDGSYKSFDGRRIFKSKVYFLDI